MLQGWNSKNANMPLQNEWHYRTVTVYSRRPCVYTDALDNVCSGLVTEVPVDEIAILQNQKSYERPTLLAGGFSLTQFSSSILKRKPMW